ncbi:uncharacterized protein LODBEIA_P10500 [Lodderomyces beijingensis]|uniref:WHIM1 domain-containing protein n=1 Tax=Lodderomyces beijingensis TaxID=1775926 RepID=A0ABP0ZJ14_9ASCO
MTPRQNSEAAAVVDSRFSVENLPFGSKEQKQALAKLASLPPLLHNQQPEQHYAETISELRNSYPYIFVVNWLYNYRGFLKLSSDPFDVDIFELELLNYFPQYDDATDHVKPGGHLFINRLKLALMTAVQNSKSSSINNFEAIFRLWFGIDTPLGGIARAEDGAENDDEGGGLEPTAVDLKIDYNENENLPKFDYLLIKDKFEILYILISYVAKSRRFREWVSKLTPQPEASRIDPSFTIAPSKSTRTEYFLLFEDSRLYSRTITFNPLVIAKKRKLAPTNPQDHYKPSAFDISDKITFQLQYKNIFEFASYLDTIKTHSQLKQLYSKLTKPAIIAAMFDSELKKRRFILSKKKEAQLAGLLAVRKRSSRIEARERQRTEEEAKQRELEQEELKLAAQQRFERRQKLKQRDLDVLSGSSSNMTRDERLRRRNEILYNQQSSTPTPMPESVEHENEDDEYDSAATNGESEIKYERNGETIDISSDDDKEEEEDDNDNEKAVGYGVVKQNQDQIVTEFQGEENDLKVSPAAPGEPAIVNMVEPDQVKLTEFADTKVAEIKPEDNHSE